MKKCKVTDIPPIQPGRKALENLPCQKMISYLPSNVKSKPLPANFETFVGQPYECDKTEEVLLAARTMTLPPISNSCSPLPEKTPTWHGMHALTSKRNLTCKNPGFLPVLSYLATRHDTVYTCLMNFSKICAQLPQKVLPVFCDEGEYQYVVDYPFTCAIQRFSLISFQ